MIKRILIPLPATDFDPTEAGVTWKILNDGGIKIVFATPYGNISRGDERMITGRGLGIWSGLLKADSTGVAAYSEMLQSKEFQNPLRWADAQSDDFDGLVIPGGHAPGMREYLESTVLQKLIADIFAANKLIGAICHGVVLVARSKSKSGRSVLEGYKVTALLRTQEMTAWALTYLWLKNYYRTYDETVQFEVSRNLADPKDFISGPIPLNRDSLQHLDRGFIIKDRNLITARWPGDAHLFGKTLVNELSRCML